jgi:hypothetical protein
VFQGQTPQQYNAHIENTQKQDISGYTDDTLVLFVFDFFLGCCARTGVWVVGSIVGGVFPATAGAGAGDG